MKEETTHEQISQRITQISNTRHPATDLRRWLRCRPIFTFIVRYLECRGYYQCPVTCSTGLHLHVGWHAVLLFATAPRSAHMDQCSFSSRNCRQHCDDCSGCY